jgi:hypothetical protein
MVLENFIITASLAYSFNPEVLKSIYEMFDFNWFYTDAVLRNVGVFENTEIILCADCNNGYVVLQILTHTSCILAISNAAGPDFK